MSFVIDMSELIKAHAPKTYVIMNGWVGNCMCFWRKGKAGYTINFDDAHQFTLEEATKTCRPHERIFEYQILANNTVRSVNPDIKPEAWEAEIKSQE